MFLKNTSKKDIKLRSFEGYTFSVPVGVSAIWDKAGEQMLKVHKIETKPGKDKFGFNNGGGIPAIVETTEKDWDNGGRFLADVKRFPVVAKLIPRAALIKLALQRGVSANRCTEYQLDTLIDTDTIAQEINELPVPDEVKRPINIEKADEETTNTNA